MSLVSNLWKFQFISQLSQFTKKYVIDKNSGWECMCSALDCCLNERLNYFLTSNKPTVNLSALTCRSNNTVLSSDHAQVWIGRVNLTLSNFVKLGSRPFDCPDIEIEFDLLNQIKLKVYLFFIFYLFIYWKIISLHANLMPLRGNDLLNKKE